jgi:glyoxylase-like metal-dependent hydrolase (beta-lactamase superfamily II)
MINKIAKDIYMIKVPLPENPLKNLNSYLIKGTTRNLLIDTGFNTQICYDALSEGIKEAGIDMDNTDIFLTHLHSDHAGLCARIASPNSNIYMSRVDSQHIKKFFNINYFENLETIFYALGFSKEEFADNIKSSPIVKYAPPIETEYTEIEDGFLIDLGNRVIKAVLTPGHTPGHMCLYIESEKLLFSGDHVIFDITPNITKWRGFNNSLRHYMDSLNLIKNMPVELTFSSHRNPMGNCIERIDELLNHHEIRITEAHNIVRKCPGLSPYDIAAKMTWSIRAKDWKAFPVVQKWFATGEASAHLDYLEDEGKVKSTNIDGEIKYWPI